MNTPPPHALQPDPAPGGDKKQSRDVVFLIVIVVGMMLLQTVFRGGSTST